MSLPEFIYGTHNLVGESEYYERYPWLLAKVREYRRSGDSIGSGSFGRVYRGFPRDLGQQDVPNACEVVIKVPNIDPSGQRTKAQIESRVAYIRRKNISQLIHINQRLKHSNHFNPIIDIADVFFENFDVQLPVTIQPFLSNACSLDDWLLQKEWRENPRSADAGAKSDTGWRGISSRRAWCTTSMLIAHALRDIHLRRVTHGDVHPGNIFLTHEEPTRVIFIDFGESFVATPEPTFRSLNLLRPYHAPELASPCRMNESLDVYSFGILLLYLATGKEVKLNFELASDDQRANIERLLRDDNSQLLGGEPRILDLICGCTMVDPANRPRMIDVVDDLERILSCQSNVTFPMNWTCCPKSAERALGPSFDGLLSGISSLSKENPSHFHPVLIGMLRREVEEVSRSFETMQTEMVDLYGTRERMLRVLIDLVDTLQKGDSWTSATTLNVWQGSALGLAGRFSSACIRATRRNASIRRVLILPVEELGLEYCSAFAARLKTSSHETLQQLGEAWTNACKIFQNSKPGAEWASEELDDEMRRSLDWHQERFRMFLEFWSNCVSQWELSKFLDEESKFDISKSKGYRISLHPVATRIAAEEIRAVNPAVLAYLPSLAPSIETGLDKEEDQEKLKWLLVSAETRGRRDASYLGNRPHLIGVRVHPSVFGVPGERIKEMNTLLNNSVNVSAYLNEIVELCEPPSLGRRPR